MKIDHSLNLVIPIYDEPITTKDEATGKESQVEKIRAYIHAAPLPREAFNIHWFLISKAFNEIYVSGLSYTSGPRVAALMLKRVAKNMGAAAEEEAEMLFAEIRRNSNVLVPSKNGWETIPLDEAIQNKTLDDDDVSEVVNAITFFTLGFAMHARTERETILREAAKLWGGQIDSSPFTEFRNSLPKLTATEGLATSGRLSSLPA